MFIVMIASECAPVAKVGGLGDVVFGLSRELEIRGNSVEIILPKYDCLRYDQIWTCTPIKTYGCRGMADRCIAACASALFTGANAFSSSHTPRTFLTAAFSTAATTTSGSRFFAARRWSSCSSGKHPDIIHCHDWQTGLVPVLLFELYQHLGLKHPRVCYTVHNFQHQGTTGRAHPRATGLRRPDHFFPPDRLQDNFNRGAINLMKGGIVYCQLRYDGVAALPGEARIRRQSYGLGHTLQCTSTNWGES